MIWDAIVPFMTSLYFFVTGHLFVDTYTAYELDTLWPRQNDRNFAGDILKCIFLNENVFIPIVISLNFVPKGPIDNIPALV